MTTYVFNGYYGGDFLVEGGGNVLNIGSRFMLDPSWDVSNDVRSFTFTDDDPNIAGDNFADEHGNDLNQYVTVRDASGTVLASGQAYLESSVAFIAPDGSTITMYIVEINGAVVGEITSAPLQPGVTYQVSSVQDVTFGPTYSSISSTSYDPDLANLISGGQYNDSLLGGAGNDTVEAGGGDDSVDGGAGNDWLDGDAGDDTLIGGTGSDTLTGGTGSDIFVFGDGDGSDLITDFDMTLNAGLTTDQLDVSALHDGEGNPVNAWDVSVGDDGSGNAVLTFPGGESITLLGVSPGQLATAPQLNAIGIPCLVAGTPVATPRGPVPVEALRRGDLVCTRDGPPQPVLWTAARQVSAAQLRADPRLLPVEIRAGALGNARALRLSPLHALLVPEGGSGALARAGHLAATGWGGARVLRGWVRHDEGVRYHHLLLPHHALIAAGGLWVESFWPGRAALSLLNAAQRLALIRACPGLARVIWGGEGAETAYGSPVRPFLRRCQIDHAACAKWSLDRRGMTLSDGFATEAGADATASRRRGIDG